MSIIFLKICNLVLSSIFFGWLPFKDINSANTSLIIGKCKFKCDNFTGVVGQQRIPKIFLEDFLFPIPPIFEQLRIANQIQHYFNLLDIIDQNQAELQQLSEQLRQKVLDVAMQGKLVPQDPNDEPASVLLEKFVQKSNGSLRKGNSRRKT